VELAEIENVYGSRAAIVPRLVKFDGATIHV